MARPSKYTTETGKLIIDAVATMVPIQVAAQMAGIANSTFYYWLTRHPEFSDGIKKASAKAEATLIRLIASTAAGSPPPSGAGRRTWQAAAWLLERHPKYRDRWAVPKSLNPTTPVTTTGTPTK